jgi:hypothetical protein
MIIQDKFIDYKKRDSFLNGDFGLYKKNNNYFLFLTIGVCGGLLCIFTMVLIPYFLSSNHTKFMKPINIHNQNYYLNANLSNIPVPTNSL